MTASQSTRVSISLLVLRVSTAAFLAVWTAVKFVAPERAVGVYDKFYRPIFGVDLPIEAVAAVGGLQAAIVLAFALGIWKFWSYGAVLIMHGVSTASTYGQLLDPSEGRNLLFWAAVPVLAGCLGLFLMRDLDRIAVSR